MPKHGHENVERNKLKRRLKEIARTRVLPRLWEAGASSDLLIRARREAYAAAFAELAEEIDLVMEEACSGRS